MEPAPCRSIHTGREALALVASRRVASPLDGGAEPRREIRRSGLLSGNDDSLDDVTTSALPLVLVVVEYDTSPGSTSTPTTSSARRVARPLQLTRQ